jgi:hypothetical protein
MLVSEFKVDLVLTRYQYAYAYNMLTLTSIFKFEHAYFFFINIFKFVTDTVIIAITQGILLIIDNNNIQ